MLASLFLLTGLIGCDSAPQANPPAAFAQERPAAPTATASPSSMTPTANTDGKRIPVLFLVGETLGWIEPCGCTEGMMGGLPRRVSYYLQLQKRGFDPLVFDLGDLFDVPGPQSMAKVHLVWRRFVDVIPVVDIGQGELDDGNDASAAVRSMKHDSGLHTGLHDPRWDEGPTLRDPLGRRLQWKSLRSSSLSSEPDAAAKALTEACKAELPWLVLFHGPRDEARTLFAQRHDVTVVFSGHGDEIPAPPERLPGGAWLVEAGMKGKFVQVVELHPGPAGATGNARIDARPWPPTPLDDRVPDDLDVAGGVQDYEKFLFDSNLVANLPKQPTTGGHFVGPASCKDCHAAQYKTFQSMKHSHALDALRAKNATRDPECVRCHTTGAGFESGFTTEESTPQLACVSCESCHGVGSNHLETLSPEFGRMSPEAANALCVRCHDHENSPRFEFKTYWEKIKH